MARKSSKAALGSRAAAPTNGQADLLKTLWESAVNLRGSIEPADDKRYVLPSIFLRFLSLRHERRRAELEGLSSGSREQKPLSAEEIQKLAAVYRHNRREGIPEPVPGFCRLATLDEIRAHNDALTPGHYVGSEEVDEDEEPFEQRFPRLVEPLEAQFAESARLEAEIRANLRGLFNGS
jgi:type I restriction-modification system DNA methylase subunit